MTTPRVIALGFFDGVHLGHGQLLKACRAMADSLGVSAACLTFDLHPDALVSGARVELLTTPERRRRIMEEQYGMDEVLTLHFDRELMNMPWEAFLHGVLLEQYGAVGLVCGHDFRFGRRGAGTALLLEEACRTLGLRCAVIPAYEREGVVVSSTYIRGLIEAGQPDRAAEFLGHPWCITGRVVRGAQIGRTMGTPTANLAFSPELILPPHGVYACRTRIDGKTYLAVTNIGVRPTVDGGALTVEPWLLDFSGDLYGRELTLEVHRFLRGEQKFPSLEALRAEIRRNADQTREYFQRL